MPLGSCKVRVNITALVIDGIDSDDNPDDTPLSATLRLEPMVKPGKLLQYDDGGVKKLKALTAIEVEIGALGDIVDRDRDYVKVPAPDATTTNMPELQWRAVFQKAKYGATPVTIDEIFFYAVPGAEINLADHINVAPSSSAVQIIRGPRGFGVVDVQTVDTELVFFAGPEGDPNAAVEVSRVPAPAANVTNSSVAPLVANTGATRTAVDTRVTAVGDTRYSRTQLVVDPADPDYGIVADATGVVTVASAGRELAGAVRLSQFSFSGTAWVDVEGVEIRLGTEDGPVYVEFNAGLCVVNGTTAANIYVRILDTSSTPPAIVPGAFATAYVPANAQGFSSVQLPVIRGRLPAGRPEHRLVAQIQNTDGQLSYIIPDWLPGKQGVLTAFGA